MPRLHFSFYHTGPGGKKMTKEIAISVELAAITDELNGLYNTMADYLVTFEQASAKDMADPNANNSLAAVQFQIPRLNFLNAMLGRLNDVLSDQAERVEALEDENKHLKELEANQARRH